MHSYKYFVEFHIDKALFSASAYNIQLHLLCSQTVNKYILCMNFFSTFSLFLQSLGKTDIIFLTWQFRKNKIDSFSQLKLLEWGTLRPPQFGITSHLGGGARPCRTVVVGERRGAGVTRVVSEKCCNCKWRWNLLFNICRNY